MFPDVPDNERSTPSGEQDGQVGNLPYGRFRRRRLPHWDVPGAIYFVTTCLEGSIPARGLLDVERYRRELDGRKRPANTSVAEWRVHLDKLLFVRREKWLDEEPAVRHFDRPELADEVVGSIRHFNDERYEVFAFVVMPSHVHWVFRPDDAWATTVAEGKSPRERIMHSLKRHTAMECNRLLGRSGRFWQQESYDHWVRDADELERVVHYVELNPVRAGLCERREDWPHSSARCRQKHGVGLPLRFA